jgi:hypothetical protein
VEEGQVAERPSESRISPRSIFPYNWNMPERKLRVFLCHASQDKSIVRELYQRFNAEGWIDPWLDEEKLG